MDLKLGEFAVIKKRYFGIALKQIAKKRGSRSATELAVLTLRWKIGFVHIDEG